jgi:hypothetical protein
MADPRKLRRSRTSLFVPEEMRPKARKLLARWITFGVAVILVFLAGVGLIGGWASSVVNWPHGGAKEVLGYLIGCLAILSIPTVAHAITVLLDILHLAKSQEDESIERRLANMHGMIDETADLMDQLRQELADRSAALQALTAQKKEYENLAALNREEAEAVSRLVDKAVANANRRSTKVGYLLFILGLLTSIPLGVLAIWIASLIHR